MKIRFSAEVESSLVAGMPVLALESTIIAHGMPHPDNVEFALESESICRQQGVVPAIIAVIKGECCVGLEKAQIEFIAKDASTKKVSRRELGIAIAKKWSGGTTVSATMHIANQSGLSVFSTGGIGGVHRGAEKTFDVSQDLISLSQIPMVVVSAGAKAVLDLPKTLEALETLGVPVLGFETNEFPAFYSRNSGLCGLLRIESPREAAHVYRKNIETGLNMSTLVVNPVPEKDEIPDNEIENIICGAIKYAREKKIKGKDLTPFLLKEIVKKTDGRSLETNKALAINNVNLGIQISKELS
ncbi:MAG: pseudouridine-5'-phosphate glycosidase [Candidatus Marinimicrobia bacterium]|nr:pseudouridine-5'-phosphate glycosidase [Candidatus Neomarinimicrobiota bacterium]